MSSLSCGLNLEKIEFLIETPSALILIPFCAKFPGHERQEMAAQLHSSFQAGDHAADGGTFHGVRMDATG